MAWAVTERAAVVQLRSRLPPVPGRSERPSPPVHPVHGLQLQRQMDVAAAVARVQVHHDVDLLVPAATDALGPSEAEVDDLEPQRAADGHVVGRRRRCSGTAWASHKYLRLVAIFGGGYWTDLVLTGFEGVRSLDEFKLSHDIGNAHI
ncbi:unnamed protein product [Miscanthus lutarioriparius]|uniref:Uncharacterized protein n=1 Tax=Miscanthus lutarioriparius TaxID=422564 RepID=A0A811NSI8_9POAL|nr:unnamed protein product [Miscanthus lutarioriparius]